MASGARGLALAAVVRLVVAATTGGESNLVERVPGDIPNEKGCPLVWAALLDIRPSALAWRGSVARIVEFWPGLSKNKGRRSWDGGPWGCCYFNPPAEQRARPEERNLN